ncbi:MULTISPECIES: ribulose-phosphate 3-epimerase [Geobacillus]|jgi:ribulose-phosphate 3-epimerase|uniref:Ribulose-phosphate 3-epimerase n=1 Tax=Geobacillus thermodenitrificans TaxID=33940 RepID=A0ABY9QH80_GEOTD|nr:MULTISPECIES: ribulose-phosphate 3-epimerase [Geobacillus]ARA97207.1 ribulose-phosphate 3-epimerase [Geobacillus thermodenitrificans]ARP42166.1 Ribulose-phosphate 3-epimerase [Geobacillus thermodenitrificans]ATO36492.1 ribulose-phosphate 3-epimerase [Geobacillus thermodenitrificans]KQB93803.1 Ribulose-phosphate 3-epimerase [Geobacillus sp. PA-3]MEC5188537.1 ribulose-phosphate 3-epimerase [Geobacillus thermodenitrificans]
MIRIAPSILSADFARLAEEIRSVEEGGADWIHVDVMDGHFVPNLTLGPPIVAAIRPVTKLPLDVHLMITDPDRYIPAFVEAGADLISVHVEACVHLHRTIHFIKEQGVKAGVVLNPHTPVDMIRHVIADVDLVLLMSVNPGFGGQAFIPAVVPKIREVARLANEQNKKIDIEVDGGVNAKTAPLCVEAGANVLVAGSAIYNNPDRAAAIRALREVCTR